MNKWTLYGAGAAAIVVLSFLVSSSYVRPLAEVNEVDLDRKAAIALRQIAHEVFQAQCDSSSYIPPVQQQEDARFLIKTARYVDYELLQEIGPKVIHAHGIRTDFSLALEDCQTNQLRLGFRYSFLQASDNPSCTGRDQPKDCYHLSLALHPELAQESTPPNPFFLVAGFSLLSLLLIGAWKGAQPGKADPINSEPQREPNYQKQLSQSSFIDQKAQTLTIGSTVTELTFREMKLLLFLAETPNEVIKRSTLNDAVWGEEGLLVGRSLDVFISRLRKKLKADESVKIVAVHGVGYKLLVD